MVQTSQSLNAGVAIGRAEALDPELAEIVAGRLRKGAQAERPSARDSFCLQACIFNVGGHITHRLCSTDDFYTQSWHARCWLLRANRRNAIQGELIREEYRLLLRKRRMELQAAVAAIEAMDI